MKTRPTPSKKSRRRGAIVLILGALVVAGLYANMAKRAADFLTELSAKAQAASEKSHKELQIWIEKEREKERQRAADAAKP